MNDIAEHRHNPREGTETSRQEAASLLHAACAVYTQPEVACRILDSVGWTANADLTDARLLEPAAGDGAFLKAAATRLLESVRNQGMPLTVEALRPRIVAYELIACEASKARSGVLQVLERAGVPSLEARRIARSWVKTADFLLLDPKPGSFTHVVGNPPYMRWSKIPRFLRKEYEGVLPDSVAKGDLFLPFMDRGISALRPFGRLGFVCSDRWKYMAFAAAFRRDRLSDVDILQEEALSPSAAFERNVSAYPLIVVMERRTTRRTRRTQRPDGTTLADAGFVVRVGPALGCTNAFILPNEIASEVEDELLAPWLRPSDVLDGRIRPSSRKVICLHDGEGRLRNLAAYPKARRWLEMFRGQLKARAIVCNHGSSWYRPIDRVMATTWTGPKLLVPELARVPRVALDRSGAIPAHGIYAIQASRPGAEIDWLANFLANGRLSQLINPVAPKTNGGYVRCYKRFLDRIVLR